MAILLSTKPSAMQDWRDALLALDPGLEIRMFPEAGDPAEIEAAVVWTSHDMAELRRYPNLRLIVSMGAGVDHLLRPPGPPGGGVDANGDQGHDLDAVQRRQLLLRRHPATPLPAVVRPAAPGRPGWRHHCRSPKDRRA